MGMKMKQKSTEKVTIMHKDCSIPAGSLFSSPQWQSCVFLNNLLRKPNKPTHFCLLVFFFLPHLELTYL